MAISWRKLLRNAKTYHRWIWHTQISWRRLSQVALKSQNSWMFSPSKVFHYKVIMKLLLYMHLTIAGTLVGIKFGSELNGIQWQCLFQDFAQEAATTYIYTVKIQAIIILFCCYLSTVWGWATSKGYYNPAERCPIKWNSAASNMSPGRAVIVINLKFNVCSY